jgi:RNA polymerase sigma-70 factor (ECF subfamily)
LYRITINLCLDFLKSAHGRRRHNQVDELKGHNIADASSPEKEFEKHELMELIQRMANGLTPRQRAVFMLRDLEALPVEEVCGLLSMSASSVKSNLYYARLKINEGLKMYYQTNVNPMSA